MTMTSEEMTAQLGTQNLQITQLENQTLLLSQELEKAANEHNSLRTQSASAVMELKAQIKMLMEKREKGMNLCKVKNLEPDILVGNDDKTIHVRYKRWARRLKGYCEACETGFRKILDWAEAEHDKIGNDSLALSEWTQTAVANAQLYNLLILVTTEEALTIVEKSPDQGFEAWRALKQRYNPTGGKFELDRLTMMFSRKPCSRVEEVPAAADKLEKDIRHYDETNRNPMPDEMKVVLLLKMLPEKYKEDIELKFSLGERNYQKMLRSIVGYSNDQRVSAQRSRNSCDMDVDNLAKTCNEHNNVPRYTEEEWGNFQTYNAENNEYIDYMGKKGAYGKGGKKGKGKGGNGEYWQGKNQQWPKQWQAQNGDTGAGKGTSKGDSKGKGTGGTETRTCYWCGKPGHLKAKCRRFLQGHPKVAPQGRPAGSMEEEWEEEDVEYQHSITDEEYVGMLCEECTPLEENDDDDDDDEDDDEEWERMTSLAKTGMKLPLIPAMAKQVLDTPPVKTSNVESPSAMGSIATPTSTASKESLSEQIKREQRELREMIATTTAATASATSASAELRAPPGIVTSTVKVHEWSRRNRNQSAKKNLIEVLNEKEELSENVEEKPNKENVEVQTDLTLPHIQKDVMWTPSSLSPVFDRETEDETGDDENEANSSIYEVDNIIEVTSDEEEMKNEGKAELSESEKARQQRVEDRDWECYKAAFRGDGMRGDMGVPADELPSETSNAEQVIDTVTDKAKLQYFLCIAYIIYVIATNCVEWMKNVGNPKSRKTDAEINALPEDMEVDGEEKRTKKMGPSQARKKTMKLKRGITVDSGAANNVMPRRMVRNKAKIRPSKGSIRGAHYVAANNGRIPNEGEYEFGFQTSEGNEESMTFQIAEVNKALGSVAYLVDRKYRVVFDQDENGRDTSYMVHKPSGRVSRFRRDKNVWILDAMVEADETSFHRQG